MLYDIDDTATENDDYEYDVDEGNNDNDDDGHLLDAPSKSCRQHHLEDWVGGETEPKTKTELQNVKKNYVSPTLELE